MSKKLLAIFACAFLAVGISASVALGHGGGHANVIYDSTVDPLPGNQPSVGAEAYAFNQFGDEVTFAGRARDLKRVRVTLSSWACQSGNWYSATCVSGRHATFSVPMTFNIYAQGVNNRPGALIATQTKTFQVPYRPSTDSAHCTDGRWYDRHSGDCFNGLANNISFNFKHQHVSLPNSVIYGITYNTTHFGPSPIGMTAACYSTTAGCPYDSLNIALSPEVTRGSKPHPNTVYQDSDIAAEYCDLGVAGVGDFRLDSPPGTDPATACWFEDATRSYIPAVRFTAKGH
jgi:hypothetical protein